MSRLSIAFLSEAIAASPAYMAKEHVREKLQGIVSEAIANGEIADQASLDEFWKTVDMAANALRMVPYDAMKKLAGK